MAGEVFAISDCLVVFVINCESRLAQKAIGNQDTGRCLCGCEYIPHDIYIYNVHVYMVNNGTLIYPGSPTIIEGYSYRFT